MAKIQAVKAKYELYALKIDNERWTKAIDSALQTLIRQAARSWLRAMIIHVPVWTGFARGSIKFARGTNGNLGQFLNVAIPISPIAISPKTYKHGDGRVVPKTPSRGGVFGNYTFTASQHRYRFNFRTDVVYFLINEFFGSKSSPLAWHSFESGRKAFEQYIRDNILNLPKVKDFLLKVPVSSPED